MSQAAPLSHKRVIALVDGFNLYHAIDDYVKRNELKWVDIISLTSAFLSPGEKLRMAFFYTALNPWNNEKRARQQALMDVYQDQGVTVVKGIFKLQDHRCGADCKKTFQNYGEKETDINIALAMARIAHEKMAEKIILVTGDSDQLPSVRYAKIINPDMLIKVVIPPFRRAEDLKIACDENATIAVSHLERHRLPEPYVGKRTGKVIQCPGP